MRLKDSIWLGLPAGLIGPLVGILSFYFVKFGHASITEFFELAASKNLLSPLLSLCAIINLGVFYGFIQLNYLYSARGVILSTFVYGLIIIALKFFS